MSQSTAQSKTGDSGHHGNMSAVSAAGLLIAFGIIYGDIGTSPLYVMKAIIGKHTISELLVLGGVSCVIWTLTLLTTVKYVIVTLRADNKGEGGIFSLYALVRRRIKWVLIPAIIGGAALLADGLITPPISVASAIEGLRLIVPDIQTVPIVISIIVALFVVQQFGTKAIGRGFGPIMLLWFSMLGLLGISQIGTELTILKAFNPYYAYKLLVEFPQGFWLLGSVFLCTTGAEALYSDLGHCGRANIRVSWIFVKAMLILNYLGQGAWLLNHTGSKLDGLNPFYGIMPEWLVVPGIVIATLAAIIASQALISGSYTLVTEALRLNLWPRIKINYPSDSKGQVYSPSVNWGLMIGCIIVVLYFQESSAMEAAYGLSITITMLMTSILLVNYLAMKHIKPIVLVVYCLIYFSIEGSFLVANLLKFPEGGWFTLVVASLLFFVMWVWHEAARLRKRYTEEQDITKFLPLLTKLSDDESVAKFATHLVFMTAASRSNQIESKIQYSIFNKQPKRADVYYFIHVEVLDVPYKKAYQVHTLVDKKVFRIDFMLGFREEQRLSVLFRQVVQELDKAGEVELDSRYKSLAPAGIKGDFRFVVINRYLSPDHDLPLYEDIILESYFAIKKFALSEPRAFGLDTSSVTVETVPLVLAPPRDVQLQRVTPELDVEAFSEELEEEQP